MNIKKLSYKYTTYSAVFFNGSFLYSSMSANCSLYPFIPFTINLLDKYLEIIIDPVTDLAKAILTKSVKKLVKTPNTITERNGFSFM